MIDQQQQRLSLLLMMIAIMFATIFVDINNNIHHTTTVSAFSRSTSTTTRIVASTSSSSSSSSSSSILSMASSMAPTSPSPPLAMLPEGLLKTIVTRGQQLSSAAPIQRGDVVTVKYTCYAVGRDDDKTDTTNVLLARSEQQKGVVGDGSMVPGWDAAIRSMKLGERAIIRITDPTLGYKNTDNNNDEDSTTSSHAAALTALGISVETQLELDVEILKIQTAKETAELFDMNFDSMAMADDTPRTPADIQAAYETKMALKAPDRDGWEGWLDTVKNYYFFGFFEGETGEDAPWYLTPSITFPLAFSVVGAAFWISLASGAISEKGQQSIDELDLIVKTTTLFLSSI